MARGQAKLKRARASHSELILLSKALIRRNGILCSPRLALEPKTLCAIRSRMAILRKIENEFCTPFLYSDTQSVLHCKIDGVTQKVYTRRYNCDSKTVAVRHLFSLQQTYFDVQNEYVE